MGMSGGAQQGYNADINVTPMVDVMLVLLIIFMVITPMLQSGVNVTLPKNKNPDEDQNIIRDSAIVISIPDAGAYFVKKEQVVGKERLIEKVKSLEKGLKPTDPHVVYIRGGIGVPYREIVQVVNWIRDAGFDQIGLVADKRKDK